MNNDLISREALKEALGEQIPNVSNVYDMIIFIKLIEHAPTVELFCSYLSNGEVRQPCVEAPCKHERPQGEWISVDEGLPEALQSVLVTSKSGRVYTSYIAHGDWEYGGDVIAWQPLPEPYKEGGAE